MPLSADPEPPRPLVLEPADRDFIRLVNDVAGIRREIRFSAGDETWWIRLQASSPAHTAKCRVTFSIDGHGVSADASAPLPAAWLAPAFAGIDFDSLPEDIRDIVWRAALEPLVNRAFGGAASLAPETIAGGIPDASIKLGWEAGKVGEPRQIFGEIAFAADVLQIFANYVRRAPPVAAGEYSDLPVRTWFEAGSTDLQLRDLAPLRPGDITLLDEAFPIEEANGFLVVGDLWRLSARIEDNKVTITGKVARMPDKTAGDTQSATSLDDLPVHLSFTLGETVLTLRELKQLQQGYTFELTRPANEPVQVRANGKVIGSGELVRVGDQIGVRLIQIASS